MIFHFLFNKKRLLSFFLPLMLLLLLISKTSAQTEWTVEKSGTKKNIYGVVWTGEAFVAVGGKDFDTVTFNTGIIIYSIDGKKWTIVDSTLPRSITDIVYPDNGKDILATGYSGYISRSSDGITWTTEHISSLQEKGYICEIMWDGSRYIAAEDGGVYISTDGKEWSDKYTCEGGSDLSWYDIAWSGDLFICGEECGLLLSTDGVNWDYKSVQIAYPSTVTWTGNKFVLANNGTSVRHSTDGISWSDAIYLPRSRNRPKTIPVFSLDALDKRSGLFGRIRWTGKELIHVHSSICTSPDGITWTLQCDSIKDSAGTKVFLRDIAWNDDIFVAVGTGGTILTSPRDNTNSKPKTTTQNSCFEITLKTTGTRLHAVLPSGYNEENISIAIYNLTGKKVFSQNSHISGNTIEYDLSAIPSGFYTFVAKNKDFSVEKTFFFTK